MSYQSTYRAGDVLTAPEYSYRKVNLYLGGEGDEEIYVISDTNDETDLLSLFEIKMRQFTLKSRVKEKWVPTKHGQKFWYVNADGEVNDIEFSTLNNWDKRMTMIGNCFQTEAEAQAAAERVKKALMG